MSKSTISPVARLGGGAPRPERRSRRRGRRRRPASARSQRPREGDDGADLVLAQPVAEGGHAAAALGDDDDLVLDVGEGGGDTAVGELRAEPAATVGAVAACAPIGEDGRGIDLGRPRRRRRRRRPSPAGRAARARWRRAAPRTPTRTRRRCPGRRRRRSSHRQALGVEEPERAREPRADECGEHQTAGDRKGPAGKPPRAHEDHLGGEGAVEEAAGEGVDEDPVQPGVGAEADRPEAVVGDGKREEEGERPRQPVDVTEPAAATTRCRPCRTSGAPSRPAPPRTARPPSRTTPSS